MNSIKKIFSTLFSEGAFRIYCYFLILISAILAIDTGIKGEYSKMQNHINWVLWVGLVIFYSFSREFQKLRVRAYRDYCDHLEELVESSKTLIKTQDEKSDLQKELIGRYEKYIEGLEKEIRFLKELQRTSDEIIDLYKDKDKKGSQL